MFLYNLVIRFYYFFILTASVFSPKAKLWREGRRNYFEKLSQKLQNYKGKIIWMHCASVGEFEQGRPVLEEIKAKFPDSKILLTFFSPSGFEACKEYAGVDYIMYLPLDTKSNAKKFLEIVKPDMAIFVKYEFWVNFLNEIEKRKIPAILISAVFRADQQFFKWYGQLFVRSLAAYQQIFVQDENSKVLLNSVGVNQVVVNGDTRFDRVAQIAKSSGNLPEIEKFCEHKDVIVAGSTWPKDEELLIEIFKKLQVKKNNLALILVPHEIDKSHLKNIEAMLSKYFSNHEVNWYSSFDPEKKSNILVVDHMGILSKIYKYAKVSYLGGGFGDGIHNILEAAVYGMPLIFGPNYYKFNEAKQMMQLNCAWSISRKEELDTLLSKLLIDDVQFATTASETAKVYVEKNLGATKTIINYIIPSITTRKVV